MPVNRSGNFVSTLAVDPQVAKVIEDIKVSRAAHALGVELGRSSVSAPSLTPGACDHRRPTRRSWPW